MDFLKCPFQSFHWHYREMLMLYPVALLNLLTLKQIVDYLEFSIYKIMLSAIQSNFTLLFHFKCLLFIFLAYCSGYNLPYDFEQHR